MADIEHSMPVTPPGAWQGGGHGGERRPKRRFRGDGYDSSGGHAGTDAGDRVSLHGVDPANVTPEIQGLLDSLMGEVDTLRWRLQQSEHRQSYLEELADQDAWLPALNRRAFLRELGQFLERAGTREVSGALGIIYLDNYDALRRTAGLPAAQDALRHLARQVVGALRAADVVGAIGGAGLAVLMTTAHPEGARAKLDRIIDAVAQRPLTRDRLRLPLEPVAVLHELRPGESPETTLAEAEEELRLSG